MNRQRNQDDHVSSPDIIETRYRTGRNPYLEVQIATEQGEASRSGASGTASAGVLTALGVGGGGFTGGGGGCPHLYEYIWVANRSMKPIPMKVHLLHTGSLVYNPITTNFNKVTHCEVLKSVKLYWIRTKRGARNLVSQTHTVIRDARDSQGHSIAQGEVLSFNENLNIYIDDLDVEFSGWGDVMKLSLEKEFIYVSGRDMDKGVVAHNLKRFEDE